MTTGSPDLTESAPARSTAAQPGVPARIPATQAADLPTAFHGDRGPVFRLALKTGLLTLLTLGLYRFWARTRLRRYYWSAVAPGGQPLEYTGTGAEKLAGFFLAVTILAFWLGIANLLLMFGALTVFAQPLVAYGLSFLGLAPLWFFARYRARSYVLARTRWRAIRFGMAPGAGGYALRATWHWLCTILTLGILWPRMTFHLEAYITDRTWFGTARLHQGGDWQMLYPAFAHVLVAGALSAGAILIAMYEAPRFAHLLWLTGPWWLYGIVHYRVTATRLMAEAKQAQGLHLIAQFSVPVVARITGFGILALVLVLIAPLVVIALAAWRLEVAGVVQVLDLARVSPWTIAAAVALVIGYFALFLLWTALRHAFITLPLWRHYALAVVLTGTSVLPTIAQRERAAAGEAEGFAEALDLGAAI